MKKYMYKSPQTERNIEVKVLAEEDERLLYRVVSTGETKIVWADLFWPRAKEINTLHEKWIAEQEEEALREDLEKEAKENFSSHNWWVGDGVCASCGCPEHEGELIHCNEY